MGEAEQAAEESVRGPILIPFTLLLVFVVASFLATAAVVEERSQQAAMEASVSGVRQLLQLETEKSVAMMRSIMDGLFQDPELRRMLAARDRSGLLARVSPFFERLRRTQGVTHLYFDTPERVNLLRVHDPALAGDIIDRLTTVQALKSGDGAAGLEIGVLGSLTLRAVEPWRDPEGRIIGLVEMGQDVAGLTAQIAHILAVDLVVLVGKDRLDRNHWQEGAASLGQRWRWDRLESAVVAASTLDDLPPRLLQLIDDRAHPVESVIRDRDGSRLLYAAFLPLQDAGGRAVGDLLVVRDVTGLQEEFRHTTALVAAVSILAAVLVFFLFSAIIRRVERDYRRKKEVEQAFLRLSSEHDRIIQIEKLSEVGRTMGEVAHQLNNPLVGVINLSQLAQRSVEDPVRTGELLGEIRRAGEDCHGLVRRMLDFTKASRSERHPTDLSALVRETAALFHQSAGSGRTLTIEGAVDAPTLAIDPILVRHALFNLLANADAASPVTEPILIRIHRQDGDGQGWGLSVLDRGPGVAKEIRERIFVPFFSTRPEGTGLGLPVAQHVAMIHGGRVAVANRPDGGACFTLWLPAGEEEA